MDRARDGGESLQPAFIKNNIAIALASNDIFVPYMATMIYSTIANGNRENNYDFIILHSDISFSNKQRLLEMVELFDNVSLRIVDVTSYIEGYDFFVGNKENFTKESYYRLLIPELMCEYQKVLYLDGDMIALADVAELYEIDLEDYLLASSRDLCGMITYYNPLADLRSYRDKVLSLREPDSYFIAGMLLINVREFQKLYSTEYLLKFATSREWRQHDQDVLNVLCEGRIKLVSASWDVMIPEFKDYLPKKLRAELEESLANVKIIHFGGGRKPWLCLDTPFGEYFWRYAAQTPYMEEILRRRLESSSSLYSARGAMEREFREGKVGARYILKYMHAWLSYKIRRGGTKQRGKEYRL